MSEETKPKKKYKADGDPCITKFEYGAINNDESILLPDSDVIPLKNLTFGEVKKRYREFGIDNWNSDMAILNHWIAGNPDYRSVNVDFSNVNFERVWADVGNFQGFHFPSKGDVSFDGAEFGDERVFFEGVKFGKGSVSFGGITFGDRGVSFALANFGEGKVHFNNTNFGEGNVSFTYTLFGEGEVYFSEVNFGDGEVSFMLANFGEGGTHFNSTTFGKGDVSFNYSTFGGRVSFPNLKKIETIKSFSFKYADFKSGIVFEPSREGQFICVPDFTGSHIHGHFSTSLIRLDEEKILENIKKNGNVGDIEDTTRALCRLKELAENNSDHEQALDYWALEMQVNNRLEHAILENKRFNLKRKTKIFWRKFSFLRKNTNFVSSGFYFGHRLAYLCWMLGINFLSSLVLGGKTGLLYLYAWLSNYGRSIGQPFLWLVGLWLTGAAIYYCAIVPPDISNATLCSLSNTLPKFITPDLGLAENSCDGLIAWDVFQTLLSFVLLFLFGLGVRNRFRI